LFLLLSASIRFVIAAHFISVGDLYAVWYPGFPSPAV
jgi:hypothetical protein